MMQDDIKKILVSKDEIEKRCEELGKQISQDYKDKNLILLSLLKGSVPFMAELMKYIDIYCETEYMQVSSYAGTKSTQIKIVKDVDRSVEDCDIIIVEDIVDTGKTTKTVKELLLARGASSVTVATLLNKKEGRLVEIEPEYSAFDIPNEFVIGFGLDFNQKFRNLPYVGVLKEECYKE